MEDAGDYADDRGLVGLTLLCASPCDRDNYHEVVVLDDGSIPFGDP